MSEPMAVSRRLVAVFAADVEGYSRLMGADEVGTLKGLTERRAILDRIIGEHRGRIANTAGDSVLAEFGSAVDAVQCAAEAQTALAEANSGVPPDKRINFRIGVHIGDVMVRAGDLFGDGVNIAARLQTLANPGAVCISGATYDQVRKVLPMTFVDLGAQQVKNIQEPIRAYQVGAPSETKEPAPVDLSETANQLQSLYKPSIAVLPFQNMSGDTEQEYFADGMVEDLITALSRFKSLFVIARNSSFTYKGKSVDIKQVGRELGVRYVLEGSVRKGGETVRITAQLIDTTTGTHLWADRFDGNLDDVFKMQDSVSASVVGAIAPRLANVNLETISRKLVEIWGAYDYYLRGLKFYYEGQAGNLNATLEAQEMFRKAVGLDPAFGCAYAQIAFGIFTIRDFHGHPISEAEHAEALSMAEQAVQLAGDDEGTLANAAWIFGFFGDDYERSAQLADRALALNPNLSYAWNTRGIISVILGEHERAIEAFAKVMRLNPLDNRAVPLASFGMASAHLLLGRYEESAGWARKMLALAPTDIRGLLILTGSASFSGKSAEANDAIARIKKIYPHMRSSHMRRAYRVRRPCDMAVVERVIALVGLPD